MLNTANFGDPNNKLWIVCGCPKRGDTLMPLSSQVGKTFIAEFHKAGVPISDIHFEYLINKVPPMGEQRNGVEYFMGTPEFQEELSLLKEKIREYKPNLVLGLGSPVLASLFRDGPILKWRGHPVWSDELGCKLMFTFDPYHAFTQRQVHKDQKPGQYQCLMENDIRRASIECQNPNMLMAEPRLEIGTSYTQVMDTLWRMYDRAKIISYDIEVFEPYEGRLIDCIGLCDNTGFGICIPFYIQNPDNKIQRFWRSETEYYDIFMVVKKILESNIPKVAQNSQFDTTMLQKYYGIHVKNLVWDTMVAQHNLYCDLPKDLGTLISLYTKLPYHKYMIHNGNSMDRWLYNAADAVANLHVMQGQICEFYDLAGLPKPALPETGEIPREAFNIPEIRHYYRVSNPAISTCVYMHIAGVRVDTKVRQKVIDIERGIMSQLSQALNLAIPVRMHKNKKAIENFNPLSPDQKGKLFYDILKCKAFRNKGKVTADKHAMESFLTDKRDYVKTLAKACLAVKSADARLLKFKVEPDNGYIRTQYDVTGTDTGRLSSKESDVMKAGTNLQNVAKGPQRQMIIPENGEEFALVDLYAAEAYLNALDSGEIEMLKMISGLDEPLVSYAYDVRIMESKTADKYKIHNWMQNETYKHWPEECKAHNYTYKLAKQTIHGLNYNVMPDKMSHESGLPMSVTSWQYSMYHQKFPGIKGRMSRINTEIKRTHSLHSPLGRRRFFMMDVRSELFNIAYAWPSQSAIGEITLIAQNNLHLMTDLHEMGFSKEFTRPVLNSHDGLAIRIKKGRREQAIQQIVNAFNIPMTINGIEIVIPVSIGFGPNFNDMVDEKVYFFKFKT
jgi:DNA polymerase I-like protein with 3'-5' exonuclease and polymerase domains